LLNNHFTGVITSSEKQQSNSCGKMWKLKVSEGESPWLRTRNNHLGRQVWEFDPSPQSPQQLLQIEEARHSFYHNRFTQKQSADLLLRMQVLYIWRGGINTPKFPVTFKITW